MNTGYVNGNLNALADKWWTLVVRGVAAIIFGILTFVAPASSLLALVILFGAYAIVDGVFNLVSSVRAGRAGQKRWGWLLFHGIVSIAAGVVTFFWPQITALVLLAVIGVWAIMTGIAGIAVAIRLRRHIRGEWLMIASGTLSIAFGALLFVFPGAGTLAVVWMIGTYAMVFGALLIGVGLRLNRWRRGTEREIPAGAHTPA